MHQVKQVRRKTNMISHTWNLKHDAVNSSMKRKQTHRHREQTGGCQGGEVWGGMS